MGTLFNLHLERSLQIFQSMFSHWISTNKIRILDISNFWNLKNLIPYPFSQEKVFLFLVIIWTKLHISEMFSSVNIVIILSACYHISFPTPLYWKIKMVSCCPNSYMMHCCKFWLRCFSNREKMLFFLHCVMQKPNQQ